MASVEHADTQWATAVRARDSAAVFVATRSIDHHGEKIVAGLTRVSETSPWLHELEGVFEKVDSAEGRAAVRSRGGDVPRTNPSWRLP
jgi:hypothetical protein